MNESSNSSATDDLLVSNEDHEPDPDPDCESNDEGESDPRDPDERRITPKSELKRDEEPRNHSRPPLVFPPLRPAWGPLHVIHQALKTDIATLLRRSRAMPLLPV